jgi:predicted site-specific integrase-resolvase
MESLVEEELLISELLTPKQASQKLGVSVGTLAVWRSRKKYPLNFVKIGGKVFYRAEHIQKFIEVRTRGPDEVRKAHG